MSRPLTTSPLIERFKALVAFEISLKSVQASAWLESDAMECILSSRATITFNQPKIFSKLRLSRFSSFFFGLIAVLTRGELQNDEIRNVEEGADRATPRWKSMGGNRQREADPFDDRPISGIRGEPFLSSTIHALRTFELVLRFTRPLFSNVYQLGKQETRVSLLPDASRCVAACLGPQRSVTDRAWVTMSDEKSHEDENLDDNDEYDDAESPGRGDCKTVPTFSLRLLLHLSLLHAA